MTPSSCRIAGGFGGRVGLAAAVAALGSGVPSTVVTLVRGGSVTASTRAAGTLLLHEEAPPARLLVAGAGAHLAISTFWATVLALVLPPRRRPLVGAAAGLGIAALDLGVIGRRFPAVRALSLGPQLADHVAFGMLVGWVLDAGDLVRPGSDGAGTLRCS